MLPQNVNGFILVTSSNTATGATAIGSFGSVIVIDVMTEKEALQLLESEVPVSEAEADEAKSLIQALDCIPIAISQAAHYMRDQNMTIRRYIHILSTSEDGQARLLNAAEEKDSPTSVMQAWRTVFDYIKEREPDAFRQLGIISMCNPRGIPATLIRHGWDGSDFEKALQSLANFSLIQKHRHSIDMHELVHFCMRKWLETNQQTAELTSNALQVMVAVMPAGAYGTWQRCKELLPHAERILSHAKDSEAMDFQTISAKAGKYLREVGEYTRSAKTLQAAYDIGSRMLETGHPKAVLEVMTELALVKSLHNQAEEAFELQQKHREICTRAFGEDDPVTLTSIQHLADVYINSELSERVDEAEVLLKVLTRKHQTILGEDHPDTLYSLSRLAQCYVMIPKPQEAEPLLKKMIEKVNLLLGPDHPWSLSNRESLSLYHIMEGDWDEAEAILDSVVQQSKAILGEEHPKTLDRIGGLAKIYMLLKRNTEAEELIMKLLETSTKVLGEEDPFTNGYRYCLSKLYESQNSLDKAAVLREKWAYTKANTLGVENPKTLEALDELAELFTDQATLVQGDERKEKLAEAMFFTTKAMEGWEKINGPVHSTTLKSKSHLSIIYLGLGRRQDAINLMEETVAGYRETSGPESEDFIKHSQMLKELQNGGKKKKESDCTIM